MNLRKPLSVTLGTESAEIAKEVTQHMLPPAEEAPPEPLKQWVSFRALLTTEDALALKAFFETRNIEFRPF